MTERATQPASPSPAGDEAVDRYLALMKGALTRLSFPEHYRPVNARRPWSRTLERWFSKVLGGMGLAIVRAEPPDLEARRQGRDWPGEAITMIGMSRLDNLERCVRTVVQDEVPGDLIETGVWRGGASIFMRAVLAALDDHERTVWVADSFAGLPPPDPAHPVDAGDRHHLNDALAISLEEVRGNFERFGLLDERVRFLPGWFSDTLPNAPIERLSVIRLDGDMYGSTIDALDALYPKLSVGGFLIIDDFALRGAKEAIHDYRREHGIEEPIEQIDWTGAFWRRTR